MPTLKRGSAGDEVKTLQNLLNQKVPVSQLPHGHLLTADGDFGADTEAAVRTFQRLHALTVDGEVGPQTEEALGAQKNDLGSQPAKPASPPASEEASLGILSAKFETGGRGPGTVSSGTGDAGGVSYGSYQMTSKNGGTVAQFVAQPDFPQRAEFANLTPGSPAFTQKWKQIAQSHPDEFQASQHAFIRKTHYDPLVAKTKADGLDVSSRSFALRNVIWSTAVQHGPNTPVVKRALDALRSKDAFNLADSQFDKNLIHAIYAERGRKDAQGNLVHFSRNSPQVQQGVANRFISEEKDALKMLANETNQ